MAFWIDFLPLAEADHVSSTEREGRIVLGDFDERFFASLEYWSEHDYQRQWKEGLSRIVADAKVSCLITSIGDPEMATGLWWWPMYRVADVVHFQNGIHFFEKNRSPPFAVGDPYTFVPLRTTVTDEGEPISEWIVPVAEILRFLGERPIVR